MSGNPASVAAFATPRSVVIVGASAREGSWGLSMTKRLLDAGFKGKIYLVNRRGGEILGLPVYRDIAEIPGEIDLALLTLGNAQVLDMARQCAAKKTKGLIIYTAGFAETGPEGALLQESLLEIARQSGMRIIGPNCNGIFTAKVGLNLTGNAAPPPGPVGLISQSGNFGLWWFAEANRRKTGLSHYFALGNSADLTASEYVEYLAAQEETRAIVVIVEGLADGRRFMEATRRAVAKKPVIVLKMGRTKAGARAAVTHTASIAGSFEIFRGALRQAGVLIADGLDEIVDVAEGLANLPTSRGGRVALIGGGGGHATAASDEATIAGLEVTRLEKTSQQRLSAMLPWWANMTNPVEFAGGADEDPQVFADALRVCLADPNVDAAILFGLFGGYRADVLPHFSDRYAEVAREIVGAMREYKKPVVLQTIYADQQLASLDELRSSGIPVTKSLKTAARIISMISQYEHRGTANSKSRIEEPLWKHTSISRRLAEDKASALLTGAGIACVPIRLACTAEDACSTARELNGPVVMRIASTDVMHKRRIGGLAVGLMGDNSVRRGFAQIVDAVRTHQPNARIDGVWIAPLVSSPVEFAVGGLRDASFGPVVMCGLGGPLIEHVAQRAFRIAPVDRNCAVDMIKEAGLVPIIEDLLGRGARQFMESYASLIVKLSVLLIKEDWIAELDLNPVLVEGAEAVVADPRILGCSESDNQGGKVQ